MLNYLVPAEELLDKSVEGAVGIAKNRIESGANIKQMLMEHTGLTLEGQFQNEIEARKGRKSRA